jgi:hypothetical protein
VRRQGSKPVRTKIPCRLESPGWNAGVRARLEKLIRTGSGKGLPVVFDFDNTIVCGDIGEATLAVLTRSGLLSRQNIPATLCPPFRPANGPPMLPGDSTEVTEYYEALLAPTVHGSNDPSPLSNGYVWAVEIMEGLSPWQITEAARTAFELSRPRQTTLIKAPPGKTGFPAPFFYDEIVELIARLVHNAFDVWVVSASNVWSVRWMVAHGLNPRLRRWGVSNGIEPQQVIGISTLLTDRRHQLYKDSVLVKENRPYAMLVKSELKKFKLTHQLQFPVPIYSGKVACVLDAIGRPPWLCVGDSPGDHAMAAFSEHRLWLARLEKPAYQKTTLELLKRCDGKPWMVQHVLASDGFGFVSDPSVIPRNARSAAVRKSERLFGGDSSRWNK